ncbi:hypothetical protein [Novosphingobium sp.]|uniref:hypothetical protein n=1 Tax=Novosphingobium sp. TaxID=1874826 RepID=UPI00273567A4|nr:hypothetical protein [Novosphingobium sp.]MDP3907835.1 hypothetical protein [Novosphingobium sp.]
MAKSKRKATNAKPITAHPLFPAVVALWFGALFGLGSLAVRPSLLEAVVIASRIDLLIPAAAPPLGVTARILLALGLSTVGSAIGLGIARRITRAPVQVPQRKRTGVARDDVALKYRARDAHPDAPARRPISATDELDNGALDSGAPVGALAGRRRALAVELPVEVFIPHELAPLPGAVPHIFDIADMELGTGVAASATGSVREDVAPLDLGSFAQPVEPAPAFARPAASAALDWTAAAPAAAPADGPMELPAAMRAPGSNPPVPQAFQPIAPTPSNAGTDVQPRQIFGVTAIDDHVPQDFVKAAGFKTSVFEVEASQPLFPDRVAAAPAAQTAPEELTAPAPLDFSPPASAAPVTPAAPAAPLPALNTLGMVDLAARLAESMHRRRAARTAAAAQAVSLAEPVAEPAAEPAPYTPFAQYAPSEPIPAPFAQPASAEPAASAIIAAAPEPVELARLPAREPLAVPAPLSAMPAALRPMTFDKPLPEDDDDVLASLLPPRHLSMPALVPEPAPEAAAIAASSFAPGSDPVDADAGEDEALGAEDMCGSLLDLGLPSLARPQFVRIEEPDAEVAAFEPVVIFPGQAPRAGYGAPSHTPHPAFSPSPAPLAAPADSAPFRQFDAPVGVGAGQPVANPAAVTALDPAETERALRAALTNLQRMSGVA